MLILTIYNFCAKLMPNNYFQFKQFTVRHDQCAMKVGTDGVLLGAWANVSQCNRILDVGTGSGLVALMLAQRSQALIDGVEIDEAAYKQATQNVAQSPWCKRIQTYHDSFQNFANNKFGSYDLIVSNPPYFQNSLKTPEIKRTQARHTNELNYAELIYFSAALLSEVGILAIIIPSESFETMKQLAVSENLHLKHITRVKPLPEKNFKRVLLEFSKEKQLNFSEDELVIELQRHIYSEAYINLTRDFYLNF